MKQIALSFILGIVLYGVYILQNKNSLIKLSIYPNLVNPNYFINVKNKIYFLLKKHKIVNSIFKKDNIKLEIKTPNGLIQGTNFESSHRLNVYIYIQPGFVNNFNSKINLYNLDDLVFQLSLSLRKLDIHVQNIENIRLTDKEYFNLTISEPYLYELYNIQIVQNKLIILNSADYKNTGKILRLIYNNYLFNQKKKELILLKIMLT